MGGVCGVAVQKSLPDLKRRLRITNRKFEVNELVNISLGLLPKLIYDVFLFCYLFGLLYVRRSAGLARSAR